MTLKTIRIYAEFYDGELTSAWILLPQNCPLPAGTSPRDNNTAGSGALLEGDNCAACRIHAEVNAPS
jgi:hypothetical protein